MRRLVSITLVGFSLLLGALAAVPSGAAPPAEVADVGFRDADTIGWSATPGADAYNVYRNVLDRLAEEPGRCHDYQLADNESGVPEQPQPGQGWFYLVTAQSLAEGEGSPGLDSAGTERPLLGKCPAVMRNSVVRRTGYGWSEWTRDRIEALGLAGYIEEQLDPQSIVELDNTELNGGLGAWLPAEDIFGLIAQQVIRSVYARRQIEQAATAFWTNHFNTYWAKSAQLFATAYPQCSNPPTPQCDPNYPVEAYRVATEAHYREVEAFRDLAFNGNFRGILETSALSPAMVLFLDGYANIAGAPNENYARENLELYSMGVQGGYTQADVEALARILTGWTICKKETADLEDPLAPCIPNYWEDLPAGKWTAHFIVNRHDCQPKTLFAGKPQEITTPNTCQSPLAGVDDLTLALDAIAAHPATPRFISKKILQRFVTDEPTEAMIDDLVDVWNNPANPNGIGDLREVLRAALNHDTFMDPARVGTKIKTPLEHMASALRAVRGTTDGISRVLDFLINAQQIIFYYDIPTGFPEDGGSWIGTNNTLERQNFGIHLALVDGAAFGSDPFGLLNDNGVSTAPGNAEAIIDFFSDVLFGGALTPAERQTAIEFLNTDDFGVPAPYNPARIRQAVGFLLGLPQFQEQ